MGLNKMLQQGLASAEDEMKKAATQNTDEVKETKSTTSAAKTEKDSATKKAENEKVQKATKSTQKQEKEKENVAEKENLKKESTVTRKKQPVEKSSSISDVKSRVGRPTNESRGRVSRKQYSLTLREDDYREFQAFAESEDISFAKFVERAAREYIRKYGTYNK